MRTCLAALFALIPAVTFGGDWPQWRGPHRDGAIPADQLPDPWPPQPPPPAWRAAVGTGYGGPVVAGGRVYVLARQGGDEVCHCLDAATGRSLWRFADPVPY